MTAKTISCSAACENSYSFNCRRVRSHRKHPARLRFNPGSFHHAPCDYLPIWHPCTPSPPPHVFFNPYRFPLLVFLPVDVTQTWREKKPGGGVKRLRGNCTRNKQAALTTAGAVSHGSSSEAAATADCDRARRQDEGRRDKGRLQMTRRVASAAESAAAEVRWLSEVQERNSHPAAGRKHYGKPDELVLSNPCRDTRSRSLSLTLALVCSFSKPEPWRRATSNKSAFHQRERRAAESLISICARRL